MPAWLEPDELQQLLHLAPPRAAVDAADPEPVLDVPLGGHVRKQRVRLEHHPHVALVGWHARHVLAVDEDAPGVGPVEAGDEAERRRLAAPGGPEQGEELALREREIDPVERDHLAELAPQLLQLDVGHQWPPPAPTGLPRPTSRSASIASQVMPKLISDTAAAGYVLVSWM